MKKYLIVAEKYGKRLDFSVMAESHTYKTKRETYSGFSPVVWDRYPAPAETCRRMAKRMNTMVMSEWESRRQAEEDEAWRQE